MKQTTHLFKEVAVIGANGAIGKAFINQLKSYPNTQTIYQFSKKSIINKKENLVYHFMDLESESTIKNAAAQIKNPIDTVIITTGILHENGILPEKKLQS